MQRIDYHVMARPLDHEISSACGDTGMVFLDEKDCFMALIDALGHGETAGEIASMAETYLAAHYSKPLPDAIKGLHEHLAGTRGAVVALCRLQLHTGVLHYSGMGNIRLKRFGSVSRRLITKEGIVGYKISTPREKQEILNPGDVFIMYSDGIKNHIDPIDFPVICTGSARQIAADLIAYLGKPTDDASCIVLRYGIC